MRPRTIQAREWRATTRSYVDSIVVPGGRDPVESLVLRAEFRVERQSDSVSLVRQTSRAYQIWYFLTQMSRLEHRSVTALRALLVGGGPHHHQSAQCHQSAGE